MARPNWSAVILSLMYDVSSNSLLDIKNILEAF